MLARATASPILAKNPPDPEPADAELLDPEPPDPEPSEPELVGPLETRSQGSSAGPDPEPLVLPLDAAHAPVVSPCAV